MDQNQKLWNIPILTAFLQKVLQPVRIHVPRIMIAIDQDRNRLFVQNGLTCGDERQIGDDDLIPRLDPNDA